MKLRGYQAEMVESIRECWEIGLRSVLGVLPTGGGKTEVAIEIIRAEATPTNRVLVLTERKVLCHQWHARLRRHGLGHVGILQGENSIALSAPIVVAMAQSVRTRGIPEGVKLIVIDESHIWHQTHDTVLDRAGTARVLGLTATPLREGLGLRFDTVVVGATIQQLIDEGHLVRPRYFAPSSDDIEAALASVAIRAGDYAADQLSKAMRGKRIMGDIVGTWQRRGENRQTIAFCVDKAHAADLAAEFTAAGIAAEIVVDDTPDEDRKRIFDAFDRLEVRVLVSVGVLAIGFDSPVASCAILARPTMSTSLHIQQGGRVLRPFPGKVDALILDHAANTLTHGRLEDFVPPTDLSKVDKRTDKRTRRDAPQAWVCRNCEAVNVMADDICAECGTPRRRLSAVVVLDGELRAVEYDYDDELPGPTTQDIRSFYLMSRWYARGKGFRNAEGWAYYATARRFKLDSQLAKKVIAWHWRDLEPLPPDDGASRWFRADYLRSRVAQDYRERQERSYG
jgi:superfamily II DNA or RNA helicase